MKKKSKNFNCICMGKSENEKNEEFSWKLWCGNVATCFIISQTKIIITFQHQQLQPGVERRSGTTSFVYTDGIEIQIYPESYRGVNEGIQDKTFIPEDCIYRVIIHIYNPEWSFQFTLSYQFIIIISMNIIMMNWTELNTYSDWLRSTFTSIRWRWGWWWLWCSTRTVYHVHHMRYVRQNRFQTENRE